MFTRGGLDLLEPVASYSRAPDGVLNSPLLRATVYQAGHFPLILPKPLCAREGG